MASFTHTLSATALIVTLGLFSAGCETKAQTGALVGFIGAITSLRFCETCNKIRLTADGNLRACLADHHAINLRGALRSNQGEAMLRAHLQTVLRQKPWEHRFCGRYRPGRPMIAIGG